MLSPPQAPCRLQASLATSLRMFALDCANANWCGFPVPLCCSYRYVAPFLLAQGPVRNPSIPIAERTWQENCRFDVGLTALPSALLSGARARVPSMLTNVFCVCSSIAHTDVLMCDLVDCSIFVKMISIDVSAALQARTAGFTSPHVARDGQRLRAGNRARTATHAAQRRSPPPHPHHFVKMICCCAHSLQTGQGHAGVVCDARCI